MGKIEIKSRRDSDGKLELNIMHYGGLIDTSLLGKVDLENCYDFERFKNRVKESNWEKYENMIDLDPTLRKIIKDNFEEL